DSAAGNASSFEAEDVGRGEIEGLEAENIRIDPPAAAIEHKLEAEEVGEGREAAFAFAELVFEDHLARKNLGGVLNGHAGRQVIDRIVRVEMNGMALGGEGAEAEAFDRGELADPEGVDSGKLSVRACGRHRGSLRTEVVGGCNWPTQKIGRDLAAD